MKYRKPMLGALIVLIIWQVFAWSGLFNPIFFASPIEVVLELIKMFNSGDIFFDTGHTIYRIIISMIFASLIGIPVGILLGYFSHIYGYFGEIVDFLRSIPPIVIYPLLLISLGPGDNSRMGVAIFGSSVVLILIISKGLFQQHTLRRDYFKSIGASKSDVLKQIIWYESLPHIMTALRTAVSLSVIIIVVTEMLVGARYGLGSRVQNVQITGNIPDLFSTIIIIGILGIVLNRVLMWLDDKFVFWKS